MSQLADWWAAGGVRHAFVAPSFRSLCGDVRWTAALMRDWDATCEACLAHVVAGTTANPVVGPMHAPPMGAELKRRVYSRRRWNGTTYR